MSLISHLHPLDLSVILVFLAVNMVVGFWHRGRNQTFTEYAVGDKKFSTAVLTATIVATWISGSVFFIALERTYTQGLYYIIAQLTGLVVGLLITGLVVGPRMGKFLNSISVADLLGSYYGRDVQALAGISTVFSKVGFISIQFGAISKIFALLFAYEGYEVTVIASTLVILYSYSGGVKSVTFTDVVQFFTFGSLLPLLALAVWNGMEAAPSQVSAVLNNNPMFSFREVVQWTPDFRASLLLMSYLMIPGLPAQLFQRMVMARDVKQIQQSFMWATMLCLMVEVCIIWISLLLLADQPGLEKNKLVPYMVETYAYPGLKGLLGVGIIALAMSTADSALNSCAVIIANDILPRLSSRYKTSIVAAKVATLGLGLIALVLALQMQDMLNTVLRSAGFYAPIVVVPALLTLFGFKTSRRVVLMGMGAGAVTVVSFLVYSGSVNSFFPGMLANLVVTLAAHYQLEEEGGWGHNPLPKTDFTITEDRSTLRSKYYDNP